MGALLIPGHPMFDAFAAHYKRVAPASFDLPNLGGGAGIYVDADQDSQFFGQNVTNLGSGPDGFLGTNDTSEASDPTEGSSPKNWNTLNAAKWLSLPKDATHHDFSGELTIVGILNPDNVSMWHPLAGTQNAAANNSQWQIYWSSATAGQMGLQYISRNGGSTYSFAPGAQANGGTMDEWGMYVLTREFDTGSTARIRIYVNDMDTAWADGGSSADARNRIATQANAGIPNIGLLGDNSGSGTRMLVHAFAVYPALLSAADLNTIKTHYQNQGVLA